METIEFKKKFGAVAKESDFERAYEGWFKEASEIILVLFQLYFICGFPLGKLAHRVKGVKKEAHDAD